MSVLVPSPKFHEKSPVWASDMASDGACGAGGLKTENLYLRTGFAGSHLAVTVGSACGLRLFESRARHTARAAELRVWHD